MNKVLKEINEEKFKTTSKPKTKQKFIPYFRDFIKTSKE